MTATAISATFADWRTVKSRKVLQLVFEIPLEQQSDVLSVLGAPMPDVAKWVGIALLKPQGSPDPVPADHPGAYGIGAAPQSERRGEPHHQAKQRYATATPGEQAVTRAALLVKDEQFRRWVCIKRWNGGPGDIASEHIAIEHIRETCCDGNSRSELATNPDALKRFLAMELDFKIATGGMAEIRG